MAAENIYRYNSLHFIFAPLVDRKNHSVPRIYPRLIRKQSYGVVKAQCNFTIDYIYCPTDHLSLVDWNWYCSSATRPQIFSSDAFPLLGLLDRRGTTVETARFYCADKRKIRRQLDIWLPILFRSHSQISYVTLS